MKVFTNVIFKRTAALIVAASLFGCSSVATIGEEITPLGYPGNGEQAFTIAKISEDLDADTATFEMKITSDGLTNMTATLPEGLVFDASNYTYTAPQGETEPQPTASPEPTSQPTASPVPTSPTSQPTSEPTATPQPTPTVEPTQTPTVESTQTPTVESTQTPTVSLDNGANRVNNGENLANNGANRVNNGENLANNNATVSSKAPKFALANPFAPIEVLAAGELSYDDTTHKITFADYALITGATFTLTLANISQATAQVTLDATLNGTPIDPVILEIKTFAGIAPMNTTTSSFTTTWIDPDSQTVVGNNIVPLSGKVYGLTTNLNLKGNAKQVITIEYPLGFDLSDTPAFGTTAAPTYTHTRPTKTANGKIVVDYGTIVTATTLSVKFKATFSDGNTRISHSGKVFTFTTTLTEGVITSAPDVKTATVTDYKSNDLNLIGAIPSYTPYKGADVNITIKFYDIANSTSEPPVTRSMMSTDSGIAFQKRNGEINLNTFISIKRAGDTGYRALTEPEWLNVKIKNTTSSTFVTYSQGGRTLKFFTDPAPALNLDNPEIVFTANFDFPAGTLIALGYGTDAQKLNYDSTDFKGFAYENGIESEALKIPLSLPMGGKTTTPKTIVEALPKLDVDIVGGNGFNGPDNDGDSKYTIASGMANEVISTYYLRNTGALDLTNVNIPTTIDSNIDITGAYITNAYIGKVTFKDKDGATINFTKSGNIYTFDRTINGKVYFVLDSLAVAGYVDPGNICFLGTAKSASQYTLSIVNSDPLSTTNVSATYITPDLQTITGYVQTTNRTAPATAPLNLTLTESSLKSAPIGTGGVRVGSTIWSLANVTITDAKPGQNVLYGKTMKSSSTLTYREGVGHMPDARDIYVTQRFYREPVVYISLPKELKATDGAFDSYKDLYDGQAFIDKDDATYDKTQIEVSVMKNASGADVVSVAGGQLVQIYFKNYIPKPTVDFNVKLKVTVDPDIVSNTTVNVDYNSFAITSASDLVSNVTTGQYGDLLAKEVVLKDAVENLSIKSRVIAPYTYGILPCTTPFTITTIPEAAINMSIATKTDATIDEFVGFDSSASVGADMYAGDTGLFKVRTTNTGVKDLANVPAYLVLPKGADWKTVVNFDKLTPITTSNDIFNKGVKSSLYYFTGNVTTEIANAWTTSKTPTTGWTKYDANNKPTQDVTAIMFLLDDLKASAGYEATVPFRITNFAVENTTVDVGNVYSSSIGQSLVYFGDVFGTGSNVVNNAVRTVGITLLKSAKPTIAASGGFASNDNIDVKYYAEDVATVSDAIKGATATDDRTNVGDDKVGIDEGKSIVTFEPATGVVAPRLAQGGVKLSEFNGISSEALGVYTINYVTTKDADGQTATATRTVTITRTPNNTPPTVDATYSVSAKVATSASGYYSDTQIKDAANGGDVVWTGTVTLPKNITDVTQLSTTFTFADKARLNLASSTASIKLDGVENDATKLLYTQVYNQTDGTFTMAFKPSILDNSGNTTQAFLSLAGKEIEFVLTTPYVGSVKNDYMGKNVSATMAVKLNNDDKTSTANTASVAIVDGVKPVISTVAIPTNTPVKDGDVAAFEFDHDTAETSWVDLLGITATDEHTTTPAVVVDYTGTDVFPTNVLERSPSKSYKIIIKATDGFGNVATRELSVSFNVKGDVSISTNAPINAEVLSNAGFVGTGTNEVLADELAALSTVDLEAELVRLFDPTLVYPPNFPTAAKGGTITVANLGSLKFDELGTVTVEFTATVNGKSVKKEATINVQDTTPPKINFKDNLQTRSFPHSQYINIDAAFVIDNFVDSFEDNYDKKLEYVVGGKNVTIEWKDGTDFSVNKDYTGIIHATDANGNPTKDDFTITMFADNKPVITAEKTISYVLDSNVTQADFLAAINAVVIDEKDAEKRPNVADYANINFGAVGKYEVTLTATNSVNIAADPVSVEVLVYEPTEPTDPIDPIDPTIPVAPTTPTTPVTPGDTTAPIADQFQAQQVLINNTPLGAVLNPATGEYDITDENGNPLGSIRVPEGKTLEEALLESDLVPQGKLAAIKSNPKTSDYSTSSMVVIALMGACALVIVRKKLA